VLGAHDDLLMEHTYQSRIDDDELTPENLDSADFAASLVVRKLERSSVLGVHAVMRTARSDVPGARGGQRSSCVGQKSSEYLTVFVHIQEVQRFT
jgi:hypothetical protein